MIYLDNASTTKIDPKVLESMMPYLTGNYGNAGTLYSLGVESARAIAKAREQVADLIGASPEQIIFTSGGSEANNLVFHGTKNYLKEIGKTHIVTTKIEHDSVLNAARNLCIKDGFYVDYIPPVENSGINPYIFIDEIEKIERYGINGAIGLVSVMHTNNETGIENYYLDEISKVCREKGILFHTDCVQAAGCSKLDVEEIGCDFMSISSHKIHGCKGVGALYVRDKSVLEPMIFGGSAQEFGLRGGTENVAGIVGFGKACEILSEDINYNIEYVSWLRSLLHKSLQQNLNNLGIGHILHVNGDVDMDVCSGKTFSVRFDNVDGETLLLMLNSRGVCVSSGSACRSHESEPSYVLTAMGIDDEDARNSIRLSLSRMNTEDEIISAAKTIADCVGMLYINHIEQNMSQCYNRTKEIEEDLA